jgi:Ca2+-binding RTX toxin-like protein
MPTQPPITTTIDHLDISEAQSFVSVTNTGAVLNALTLGSSGNVVSINGYVGTVITSTFGSSDDDIILVGSSGLVNSIDVSGSGNTINNAGSIMAVDHGDYEFGYSAIEIGGGASTTENKITNSGTIFTANPNVFVSEPFPLESYWRKSYGVLVSNDSNTILNNSGTISSSYDHAIKLGSGSDTFTNTGTVFGDVELGEGTNTTKNSGAIAGNLIMGNGSDVTYNNGKIDGNVVLGDGDNVTYNSGTIDGDVTLGEGNNILRSGTGEIFGSITAGDGNNSIFGPSNGGQISTGSGTDTVRGGEGDDNIATGAGVDKLRGLGGDDMLNGGAGADVMIGGQGDDAYYIDDAKDVVNELQNGGDGEDTVYVAYAGNFNLSVQPQLKGEFENLVLIGVTGLENLNGNGNALDNTITGNGGINQLSGFDGNDWLIGGSGADLLKGGNGDDILDGGGAADTMVGGAGDDTYRIDLSTDIVDETNASGIDTVIVSAGVLYYNLNNAAVKGQVENLQVLTYVGQSLSVVIGNDLDNTITGSAANNRFSGLGGDDVLDGQDGDDILIGGKGADQFLGGNGTDTADFSGSAANLTVSLDGSVANTGEALGDTFSSIEILKGTNAAAGDKLIGDANANTIYGNAGNDNINGRDGIDNLIGGLGSDTVTGGLGDDRFIYNALAEVGDTITDFSAVTGNNDLFRFDHTVFTGNGVAQFTGPVNAASYITRTGDHQAQDSNDFFIFQTDTNELWYDPTGSDVAGDAVRIATLQSGATMTRLDIWFS